METPRQAPPRPSLDAPVAEDVLPTCFGALSGDGMLGAPLPALDDEEGERVDPALPEVIDAHVHLFPGPLFEAIWRWFDRWGWPVRYRLQAPAVVDHLLDRGVSQIVAMQYAHRPGLAREMNAWLASYAAREPRVTGLATVLPGEDDAGQILAEAFAAGLRGVKVHCHVQCVPADAPEMAPVFGACVEHDLPLVIHAGREPKSPGYRCDPHALCSADRMARVLEAWPTLRVVVPHLGADEYEPYLRLLDRFDNLWLDTTMAVADYLPGPVPMPMLHARPDRILYGTDFPNVPYAWDRELVRIAAAGLGRPDLARILAGNARAVFRLPGPA